MAAVRTGGWTRRARVALLVFACLLAVWCYAPALHAYFAQDDFTLLALARLLHEPALPFYHDHFPGSLFFRPLGIFLWWLTVACFDNAPRGHYAVNLLLHLGVVLALYTLLQRLRRDAPLNVAWVAAYAVHPLAIGTALWLSDRFDLIATGFSLLALAAAVDYAQRPRIGRLAAVVGCVLVAFMGKEIAIVGAIAAAALIALPNRDWPLTMRQRWTAVAAIALVTIAWLGYRQALLLEPQNALRYAGPLVAMFEKGIGLWLQIGFQYLFMDPRQTAWANVLLAFGGALIVIAVVLTARRAGWKRPQALGVAAAVLILLFLPAPTQAPVVAVSTSALSEKTFWFDLIGESRLYHLSLAGLIAALMLLTTPRESNAATGALAWRASVVAGAGLVLMLAVWIPASHALAHDFAKRSREQIAPLQAAHAAIARLPLPPQRCQIYLLDAASIWGLQDIGDPTIKASSPEPSRLEHCLVLTERAPWGNFVRTGSVGADDYRPLRVLEHGGKPVPWLTLGSLQVAYLNLDADIDARTLAGAFFLEYRGGTFVDVSEQVRSGARPVQFFNARPDEK
ncbi:MAG TPA: hypothetical protein VFL07_10815 [Rudaea sp.]|nr:hypothetical protein [Rudaea sp.]